VFEPDGGKSDLVRSARGVGTVAHAPGKNVLGCFLVRFL
jgi:hypothetical protein